MDRRRGFHGGVVRRLCRGERLLIGRLGPRLGVGKTGLRRGDRCGVGRLGSSLRGSPSGLGSSLGRGHGGIGIGHRLVVAIPGELHDRVERIGRDADAQLKGALRSGDVDLELAGGRRHCPDNQRRIADVERRASTSRAAGGLADGGRVLVLVLFLGIRQAVCGSGRVGTLIQTCRDDRPVVPHLRTGDDLVLEAGAVGHERVGGRVEPFLGGFGCGGRGGDACLKGPHRR